MDVANKSGCSADGSALPWGGRGRGFKSRHSDQKKQKVRKRLFYGLFSLFLLLRVNIPDIPFAIKI